MASFMTTQIYIDFFKNHSCNYGYKNAWQWFFTLFDNVVDSANWKFVENSEEDFKLAVNLQFTSKNEFWKYYSGYCTYEDIQQCKINF